MSKTLYGQFCPIAISLELLGGRWTFLIIRELLDGSSRFNDIHRGLPMMSRSLLSDRLKNLETAKLISRSRKAEYRLTDGGRALEAVIKSMGMWSQEWLHTALALDEVDGGYLMWNIKKSTRWIEDMGRRAVVRFEISDLEEKRRFHWFVIEKEDVELCYVDPGIDVDVWIETDLRTMVEVWMGWRRLTDAIEKMDIILDGPPDLVDDPLRWIGQSPLAGVSKRPSEERVGYLLEKVRA